MVTTAAKRKYEKKDRPALDFKAIKFHKPDAKTVNSLRRTRGERNPEQKVVDELVESVYNDWLDAGKPETWDDIADKAGKGAMTLVVPEKQLETLQYRLRTAGAFLHMSVRFGDIKNADGYATTIFRVCDPKKREKKSE